MGEARKTGRFVALMPGWHRGPRLAGWLLLPPPDSGIRSALTTVAAFPGRPEEEEEAEEPERKRRESRFKAEGNNGGSKKVLLSVPCTHPSITTHTHTLVLLPL